MDNVVPLSPREREILALVADGLSSHRIARRLVITVATVRTHVENIRQKLGVHNRPQAVSVALAQGLLPVTATTVAANELTKLAPRERQVLGLVAEGLNVRQIAESLGITIATSRSHLERIRNKLSVATIAQAVTKTHLSA